MSIESNIENRDRIIVRGLADIYRYTGAASASLASSILGAIGVQATSILLPHNFEASRAFTNSSQVEEFILLGLMMGAGIAGAVAGDILAFAQSQASEGIGLGINREIVRRQGFIARAVVATAERFDRLGI